MKTTLIHNLKKRHKNGLYRTRDISSSLDTKSYLSFSSNDYLGLANHPEVIQACKKGLEQYGIGSGASQLLGGYSYAHHSLEEELAEFLGYERVLLFSTGYMANLGVITTLFNSRESSVFADRLSHASIIDGCRHSGAHFKRYQHCNAKNLEKLLAPITNKPQLIIAEGVFSMNGDLALLPKLIATAKKTKSWLMIDDAHGIGVLGSKGRGSIEHHNLTANDVQILIGTFGKAFGTFGAFVASSKIVIENLIQFARTLIYTTAFPAAIAEATRSSLQLLQHDAWRRNHLDLLIKKFKSGAEQLNLPLLPSDTPIQPLIIGGANHAQKIALRLKQLGIFVALIRPPTVPTNTSRLRISLTANHTEEDINYLLDALSQVIEVERSANEAKI